MAFSSEPVEAGYVEKSQPKCVWYETCREKRCDGNGSVKCRIRERGTLSSRMEGEYTKITFRDPRLCRIPCVSFLVDASYALKAVSNSG